METKEIQTHVRGKRDNIQIKRNIGQDFFYHGKLFESSIKVLDERT